MDGRQKTGRVLPFPPVARASARATRVERDVAAPDPAQHSRAWWLAWWSMAWIVAAARVRLAAAQHEVFGVEATLAFLVAVVLPLLSLRQMLQLGGLALAPFRRFLSRARGGHTLAERVRLIKSDRGRDSL
jgi:hypothetical protein